MTLTETPPDLVRLTTPVSAARVDASIAAASGWLLARQAPEGFWCGELEGDTTLESYIILLEVFFGRPDSPKIRDLARTIREEALPDGGWSQYPGGPPDISVSCLSYLALKVSGESPDAPHMRKAREVILDLGGLEGANTYTRYHFAFFGQLPWTEVPAIPPEMLFLPRRSPFTIYDMSSWSRTIFIPLAILWAKKPTIVLPEGRGARELLRGSAAAAPAKPDGWKRFFLGVDRMLKRWERFPGAGALRALAVKRAAAWMIERLEDSDGLSAILPAMANSVLALKCLGHRDDDPLLVEGWRHLDGLLLRDGDAGALRVQPCLSPVWDTVLAGSALLQAGVTPTSPAMERAATWLLAKQTRRSGDWAVRNPALPGGWFFEHRNEFYPDVDDTCMALIVLTQCAGTSEGPRAQAIQRGLEWMMGMQNRDGGWGSFDRDNDRQWLTEVPFADHNAMIDPSTADITGRVLESLARFPAYSRSHPAVERAVAFLRRDQTAEGAWYGRWGVNYLYGTWQVLRGLRCIGEDMSALYVRRAAGWLAERQNGDGGWGESIASYDRPSEKGVGASTPSQTAWAVMGLIAAGDATGAAVRRGVGYLLERQRAGTWEQPLWTGTGFPRVFYLNYEYYRHTFPLMALAQYRDALALGSARS